MAPSKRKHAELATPPSSEPPTTNGVGPIEVPFSIEYLPHVGAEPKTKKRKGKAVADDHTAGKVEPDTVEEGKEVAYVIRPGSAWDAMKKYKNFVVTDEQFGINDYIYINHENIEHGVIVDTEDERKFWVARVLEVRASDPTHVYLRVYWLYWPDELPGGRREYHGKSELVVSNHMEIVDAMTVAGRADVVHWTEKDEDEMKGLYWRQTFNFVTQKLSLNMRRQCVCSGFTNPDKLLVKCANADCGRWLHEDCVKEDALKKTYIRLVGEIPEDEQSTEMKKKSRKSGTPRKATPAPPIWKGKFEAKIESKEEEDTASKLVITDVREEEPKSWEEDMQCLACHEPLK